MSLVWNPWVASGWIAGGTTMALGLWLLAVRPDRTQNRRLATVLGLEGIAMLLGTGLMYSTTDLSLSYAAQAATIVAMSASVPAYLRFLATLETPMTAWMRHAWIDRALLAAVPLTGGAYFLDRSAFVTLGNGQPGHFTPAAASVGPGFAWVLIGVTTVALLGLVASASAYRRSRPSSQERMKARAFLWAFGLRDGLFVLFMGTYVVLAMTDLTAPPVVRWFLGNTAGNLTELVYVPVLAYGILRTQLFDIDLRIKRGITRSTVVGVLLAAFFLVSEGVEALVSGRAGALAGLLTAGLLALGLRPLEARARTVADRLMPGVQDTATYRAARKEEVYRASVESAALDGQITARERAVLATLAEQLDLAGTRAQRIEHEVLTTG